MAPAATVDRPPTGDPAYAGLPKPVANTPRLATAVAPGSWGRPLRPQPPRPAEGVIGWASSPPPAPDIDLRGSDARPSDPGRNAKDTWGLVARATKRTAPAAALAVALVGVAALTHTQPSAASHQKAWATEVTPYLNAVALDVEHLDTPIRSAVQASSASAELRSELQAARAVGQSPVPAWGRLWTSALDEAQAALGAPTSAEQSRYADVTFAADDLVALGQAIAAGS
ncbi:MAG: hypothetical protein ACP5P1_08380 [Acidimicrobiales bacterium]